MGKSRKKRGFPRFFQKIHACFRFLRNALWYTMKYSTALTGMATNTSRIECTYYMKDVGSYAAWKATKATGAYDMKTFQIKARPSETVNGLRPGMSVIFPIKN